MTLVSIIIPAKNESSYIENCLLSIERMNYPKTCYEIIIADNGSTDETKKISKCFSTTHIVDCKYKKNIAGVRNAGADKAIGDIFVFLDADCTVSSDWLVEAERYFNEKNVACFGAPPIIPENSTWVEKTWYLARKPTNLVYEREWQESTNMFIPKWAFIKVNGFNEALETCEDVDLSYKLNRIGKIICDTRIIAIHHREPKSIKNFFLKEKWRGKSNYYGLIEHGIKMKEIPSLIIPLLYILMPVLITVISMISLHWTITIGALAFWQTPVLIITWLKIRNNYNYIIFLRMFALYNVYFLARGVSIFK